MTEQLGRRCALVLFVAMSIALLTGLLAWGPVPLGPGAHEYADMRAWFGLPNAANLLASLALLPAALFGLVATRSSGWPMALRRPWLGFHACALAAAVLAAVYHLAPTDTAYLLANTALSAACALLTAALLAERVDPRFGSAAAVGSICAIVAAAAGWVGWTGASDLRPFIMIDVLPVLLVPAGALGLPGGHLRSTDWTAVLFAYAAAKLADIGDAAIFAATGWLSGHALMHLGLAFVAAWLAYCAARATAGADPEAVAQRQASLNTAG